MNEPNHPRAPKDIEEYVLKTLKEIYWEFPGEISPNTMFEDLERHADPDLTDIGLLVYIEEDLGVYLPDDEVLGLDAQKDVNVASLINAIIQHIPRTKADSEMNFEKFP